VVLLKGKPRAVAKWSALAGLGLSVVAVLLHLLGLSRQPNWDVIGLVLPVQIVVAAIAAGYGSGRAVSAAGSAKNST
jgi:hypothetical protein